MLAEQHLLSHPTDFVSIDRDAVFQAEGTIKNAHTATHLRILHNQLVFICIEESIHIYSLSRIALNQAPLLNVIALSTIFQGFQKQFYEDLVTKIFRNAEKEDFSSHIFTREQDAKSNILLKVANVKNRINFLSNTQLKVKHFELNQQGNAFILLQDGRAAVLTYESSKWNAEKYQSINVNEIVKEKIVQGCFLNNEVLCVFAEGKVICIDLANRTKMFAHKLNIPNVNQLYGKGIEKDKAKLYVVSNFDLHFIEMNKKKVLVNKAIKIGDFINKAFFFCNLCYMATHKAIYKFSFQTLEKELVRELPQTYQLLHIDQLQNVTRKSVSNSKESIWLLDSTSNGVFVGLTIRKQGNYKEGRMLVFQPKMSYFIQRLILAIKANQGYINTKDSVFVAKSKENKQLLQEFSHLYKSQVLEFGGLNMTAEEYSVASINIGHAFEGKDVVKQKIIEKVLSSRFQNILSHRRLDYTQLSSRCCFSGVQIAEEQVNYCKECDLFGISSKGDRCVVCQQKMILYV